MDGTHSRTPGLVTGASRGFGRVTAIALANVGADSDLGQEADLLTPPGLRPIG
jgi:NAD(P)-dependent dehydrogenase (short-subunit alcohol dehydrogenase family)